MTTSTRIAFELSDYCPSCGVDVDLASGRVQVEYDASRLDVQDLLVTIGGAGAMARPVRG